jgi:hypothetical protein
LDVLQGELQNELVRYNETTSASPTISTLVQIFEALQPSSNKPIRRKIDGIPGSDVRLSYFETLSHLKGQYMAGTVPGNYRYFSCSHPDEAQQGMPIIEWSDGERGKTVGGRGRSVGSQAGVKKRLGRGRQPARAKSLFKKVQSDLGISGLADILTQFAESESRFSPTAVNRNSGAAGWFQQLSGTIQTSYRRKSKYAGLNTTTLAQTPGTGTASIARAMNGWRQSGSFRRLAPSARTQMNLRILAGGGGGKRWTDTEGVSRTPSLAYVKSIVDFDTCRNTSKDFTFKSPTYAGAQGRYFRSLCRLGKTPEQALAIANKPIDDAAWSRAFGNQKRTDQLADRFQQFDSEFVGGNAFLVPQEEEAPNAVPQEEGTTSPGGPGGAAAGGTTGGAGAAGGAAGAGGAASAGGDAASPTGVSIPGKPPRIEVRDIGLEVARTVVQFKPIVKSSDSKRRAPEVILSTGKCKKGLQIALGPNRAPQVMTTDQIQRIHFIRHGASKFTQVVGVSQNSGSVGMTPVSLQKQVTNVFLKAIGPDLQPTVTVRSLFETVYDQIHTDLATVPFPVYDGKNKTGEANIEPVPFDDALTIEAQEVPAATRKQLTQGGIPSDTSVYFLADFTLAQLATLPGYKKGGDPQAAGQNWQRPTAAVASAYATRIVKTIREGNNLADIPGEDTSFSWVGYNALVKAASTPMTDKKERLAALSKALDEATTKAFGANEAQSAQAPNQTQEAAVKEGINETPVHSPVFPVSDEKGYEHYGAYRYGRGLSVEPGGTFEFIHSGKDPFRNVTAQSAEEFLRVLTLVKTDHIDGDTSIFGGIKKAAVDIFESLFSQKQDPLSTEGLSDSVAAQGTAATVGAEATVSGDAVKKARLSDLDRAQVEASAEALALTVTRLGQTARGQDTLRELLEANGDDPNILKGQTFDLSQTQFFRNYLNFAANFGKSPVFKTTAANAAYRLADLTAHLLNRAGQVCICRGSYADVSMEAYTRAAASFVAPPGIDTETEKPEAFAGEQAIQMETPHRLQQDRERGGALQTPGDADAFQDGRTTGAGQSGVPLPDLAQETVSGEIGATTTADPFGNELPSLADLGAGDLTLDEFNEALAQFGNPTDEQFAEALGITVEELLAARESAPIEEVPETGPLPLPDIGDDEDEAEPLLPGIDEEGV